MMNHFQNLFFNFNLRRYIKGSLQLALGDGITGRAVQVASIKTRVESAYDFSA